MGHMIMIDKKLMIQGFAEKKKKYLEAGLESKNCDRPITPTVARWRCFLF